MQYFQINQKRYEAEVAEDAVDQLFSSLGRPRRSLDTFDIEAVEFLSPTETVVLAGMVWPAVGLSTWSNKEEAFESIGSKVSEVMTLKNLLSYSIYGFSGARSIIGLFRFDVHVVSGRRYLCKTCGAIKPLDWMHVPYRKVDKCLACHRSKLNKQRQARRELSRLQGKQSE